MIKKGSHKNKRMLSLLLAWLLPVKKKHLPCSAWDHSAAVSPITEINKLKTPRRFRMWCGLTFECSAFFFFSSCVLTFQHQQPKPSGSKSFSSTICRITEALAWLCYSSIHNWCKTCTPKKGRGETWPLLGQEQEATADPRPKGVCGERLHQIKPVRFGVIQDPVIFIALRSSCNLFDCREEKQNSVPKAVFVAFLLSFFSHKGRLSCCHSPTVTSQQWLHPLSVFFLSCCPSPLSLPHTLPFPCVPPVCSWHSWGWCCASRSQELPEHLCLPESISSPARELRPASAFQSVQECAHQIYLLIELSMSWRSTKHDLIFFVVVFVREAPEICPHRVDHRNYLKWKKKNQQCAFYTSI